MISSVIISYNLSLFLMHGHSFEQTCTKFGVWHPYTLQMVTGELASTV